MLPSFTLSYGDYMHPVKKIDNNLSSRQLAKQTDNQPN